MDAGRDRGNGGSGGQIDARDTGSDRGGAGGRGGTGASGKGGAGNTGQGGNTGMGGSGAGGGNTGMGGSGAGGGNSGMGGRAGSGGSGGTPGGASIPCGTMTCKSGAQSCCIRPGMTPPQACIPVGERCQGASIGCVNGASCGSGRFCCLTLPGFDSSCRTAEQCLQAPSVIICTADRECPAARSHCCHVLGQGICQANACPATQR
jgi:hypothetical protein